MDKKQTITIDMEGKTFKTMCGQCGKQFRSKPCGIRHTHIKALLRFQARLMRRK